MSPKKKEASEFIALITGANRGLGFETARQLGMRGCTVILTSRNIEKGQKAAKTLISEGLKIIYHPLDVTKHRHIEKIKRFVSLEFGRLDMLVNNAGILVKGDRTALDTNIEAFRETMETNTFGPLRMCRAFIPLMLEKGYGRVVNVSSGYGALSEMDEVDYPAYKMSKTALNVVTRLTAAATKGTNVLVNSICPGWVRTDMGGPEAHRSVEEGARGIVWAATLRKGGPNGGFFRDGKRIGW